MPAMSWAKNPVSVAQAYEARHGQTPLSPLFMWAVWAVDGLHYLDDVDASQANYPNSVGAHHPDIIDIAHVRWATGTAITALDLCAAALGRICCGWNKKNELDLRDFDPQAKPRVATTFRSALPASMLTWVDSVLADARYKNIQGARNPLTHASMSRHLSRGGNGGHQSRTRFTILKTNSQFGARNLVTDSKDLASDHVNAFLQVVDTL